jgi:hypothetical protein
MKTDMSPKAITNRLKQVAQLNRLCEALGKARPLASTPDQRATRPPRDQAASK